jgi:hypothetical protein
MVTVLITVVVFFFGLSEDRYDFCCRESWGDLTDFWIHKHCAQLILGIRGRIHA